MLDNDLIRNMIFKTFYKTNTHMMIPTKKKYIQKETEINKNKTRRTTRDLRSFISQL